MTDDLKLLKTSFDKIEMTLVRETKEVDENGIETVGSTKTYTYPEGTLKEIIEQVNIIRTKYIK